MPERVVIANTSPLLYLHQVNQIGLLQQLYGRILIPPAVVGELEAGREGGIDVPDVAATPWIQVTPVTAGELVPAIADLGEGEAEVIALGVEHVGSLVVLDDRLARRIAALVGLTVTGTLGVLVRGKHAGHLASVGEVVAALRGRGMWLDERTVAAALRLAGE